MNKLPLMTSLVILSVIGLSANAEQRNAPAYEVIEENINAQKIDQPQETEQPHSQANSEVASKTVPEVAAETTSETTAATDVSQDVSTKPEEAAINGSAPAELVMAEASTGNPQSINYSCNLANLNRRITVDFLEPPAAVPCQVNYFKDTEEPGVQKTLWWAENNEGYCESKAEAFVDKLTGLGWNCIQ